MFSIEIHFGWLRQVWLSSSYKMTCYINEYWFLCSEKNDCPIINNFLWLNTRKLNKKLLVNDAYLKFFFCFVYFSLHRLFLLLWFILFNLFIHSFHTYVNFIHWKKNSHIFLALVGFIIIMTIIIMMMMMMLVMTIRIIIVSHRLRRCCYCCCCHYEYDLNNFHH